MGRASQRSLIALMRVNRSEGGSESRRRNRLCRDTRSASLFVRRFLKVLLCSFLGSLPLIFSDNIQEHRLGSSKIHIRGQISRETGRKWEFPLSRRSESMAQGLCLPGYVRMTVTACVCLRVGAEVNACKSWFRRVSAHAQRVVPAVSLLGDKDGKGRRKGTGHVIPVPTFVTPLNTPSVCPQPQIYWISISASCHLHRARPLLKT